MKILKIRKPIIDNDINCAILLAIIDDKFYINGFIYNFYSQICYDKERGLKFLDYDYFFNERLFIKKNVEYPLLKNSIKNGNTGIINYIKHEINKNRYVIGNIFFDEIIYQGRILIYGYNNYDLYIATVYNNGGWVTKKISYLKFIDIIEDKYKDKNYCSFDTFYYNSGFLSEFKIEIMHNELNEYIDEDKNNEIYGINGIKTFFNNIDNLNLNLFKISLDTLYFHKSIMIKRLDFLIEKKYLPYNTNLMLLINDNINIIKKLRILINDVNSLSQKSNFNINQLWENYLKNDYKFTSELLINT